MKAEYLIAAGIPISGNDASEVLRAEAALDWMAKNTTLQFDKADAESIEALPACAKLFVEQYSDLLSQRVGVSSQSIEGLSMSFNTTDKGAVLWQLANSLLSGYLKSQVRVFPAKRRW
jgi:hypothetical protein